MATKGGFGITPMPTLIALSDGGLAPREAMRTLDQGIDRFLIVGEFHACFVFGLATRLKVEMKTRGR